MDFTGVMPASANHTLDLFLSSFTNWDSYYNLYTGFLTWIFGMHLLYRYLFTYHW